eukprot:gnl/TRDRNA2_/TRDRNA2_117354_c1_seq1.p1 gnl/TRDRNA2_/TRDRNA2_117354_c1~~gnl/TRDRNA2_/TRDRNA2_117354_c1_seq1.p1  ORF type:complete len:248 (+),score=22.59 gnl/TRDRNA2_/TRDRNA2_117354_c1_seq1:3-746(+)
MLAPASVVKPPAGDKYVVNISSKPVSKKHVRGICDHEIGTHVLRYLNDEAQVWHRHRDEWSLVDSWVTEEGLATLNTYLSMSCKLLFSQALRYWAVCQGARVGFCELFRLLQAYEPDKELRFRMCCRVKRGMIDTSKPGALCVDQAYFRGAVELLRCAEDVDFVGLYSGQLALQDLSRMSPYIRKRAVRLPEFLSSAEKLQAFKRHCAEVAETNGLIGVNREEVSINCQADLEHEGAASPPLTCLIS